MKALYENGWHHPFAAYLGGLLLLLLLARSLPFLHGYLVVFLVTIVADACVTGAWSPVASPSATFTVLSVVFVILGDLRYFLLVDRMSRPDAPFARVLLRSVAVSLIVPVTTGVLTKVVPAMQDPRVLFLVYELALGCIVIGLGRPYVAKGTASEDVRRWLGRVNALFATLYFGWAGADVLILAGVELGHAVRIVPNVLYYAVFLPFVFVTAPEALRRVGPAEEAAA